MVRPRESPALQEWRKATVKVQQTGKETTHMFEEYLLMGGEWG